MELEILFNEKSSKGVIPNSKLKYYIISINNNPMYILNRLYNLGYRFPYTIETHTDKITEGINTNKYKCFIFNLYNKGIYVSRGINVNSRYNIKILSIFDFTVFYLKNIENMRLMTDTRPSLEI